MEELKAYHTDAHLDHDLEAGAIRVDELKAGRHVDDIPLSDEYWLALAYHNRALQMKEESK